jgi:hypothetical protein
MIVMATTPKRIIDAIRMGHERYVLADTVVRLTEEFREDYIPGATTWEAFELLLILHRMLEAHQRGRESSALGPSVCPARQSSAGLKILKRWAPLNKTAHASRRCLSS